MSSHPARTGHGDDPCLSDACGQLALLRSGQISARDLMIATLARLDRLNPLLNAVVARDDAASLRAADLADARWRSGTARPLEGLPITIKDAFDVAGMISTGGSPALRERVPDTDASVVANLRAAGAIIIGKTPVPVFSGDFQAHNPLHGATANPWNLTLSPGGSSGAAAAAVAARLCAFETGSDLGGSIRWPAHACGIFGLKPSWGLVRTWGVVPPPPERRAARDPDLVVAGPLARSTADLGLVLPMMAGDRAGRLRPARATSPRGLRVAVWIDDPFAKANAAVRAGVRQAARQLAMAGALVDEAARPSLSFAEAFEIFALLNHFVVAYGLPPKVRARLQAPARDFAPGDLSHRALQARGAAMTPGMYQHLSQRRMAMKRQWQRFFTRFDVVLAPPAPVNAIALDLTPDLHARHLDVDGMTRPWLDFLVWGALASGADLPALSAPVGLTPEGLPTGVQIIAAEGEDLTALAVGRMLEDLGCGCALPPAMA